MDFRDISPYRDLEVNGQIQNLINNKLFFKQLAQFLFPVSSKIFSGLIEIFIVATAASWLTASATHSPSVVLTLRHQFGLGRRLGPGSPVWSRFSQ